MGPGQSACDDCGESVIRLYSVAGQLVQLDATPTTYGNRIIADVAGLTRVRTLTGPELPYLDGDAYCLHRCGLAALAGDKCASPSCRRPQVGLIDGVHHPECHPEVTDKLLADRRATIRRQFKRRHR